MEDHKEQIVEEFLRKSPFSGLMLLFITKVAFDTKKAFTFDSLHDILSIKNKHFYLGFMTACKAFHMIEYTKSQDILNITYINPYIDKKIEKVAKEKAIKHDNLEKSSVEKFNKLLIGKTSWYDELRKIEKFFNYSTSN
jgi:hypothetical protein